MFCYCFVILVCHLSVLLLLKCCLCILQGENIKKGMEVGLVSPNSLAVVAMATVQSTEDDVFVEVLVNVIFRTSTVLPKPTGRMTNIGQAQAQCIRWPRVMVICLPCLIFVTCMHNLVCMHWLSYHFSL
jgi:hypothetical protein